MVAVLSQAVTPDALMASAADIQVRHAPGRQSVALQYNCSSVTPVLNSAYVYRQTVGLVLLLARCRAADAHGRQQGSERHEGGHEDVCSSVLQALTLYGHVRSVWCHCIEDAHLCGRVCSLVRYVVTVKFDVIMSALQSPPVSRYSSVFWLVWAHYDVVTNRAGRHTKMHLQCYFVSGSVIVNQVAIFKEIFIHIQN